MCHACCPCIKGEVAFERHYCCCGYSPCLTWCHWCREAHNADHNNKRWLLCTGPPLLYFLWCHVALDCGQLINWLCTGGYCGKRCTAECRTDPALIVVQNGCPTWDQWLDVAMGSGSAIDTDWEITGVGPHRNADLV